MATPVLSDSITRGLAIPANHATRSLKDVEHVVVLMQENRSFDHYCETMRGVRGFGAPHAVTLPSGKSVWHQAAGRAVILPIGPNVGHAGGWYDISPSSPQDPGFAFTLAGRLKTTRRLTSDPQLGGA